MPGLLKKCQLSQKGTMAIQFLFGWVLVMGFVAIFAALTLTLVVVEISQYMVYASSRQLFLAHQTEGKQMKQAKEKYKALLKNRVFCVFFSVCNSQALFDIASPENVGVGRNPLFNPSGQSSMPYLFVGVWTPFTARILDINVPMWGGSQNQSGPGTGSFTTGVGSYLGREPSLAECESFNKQRWNWIYENHKQSQGFFIQPARDKGTSHQEYIRYLNSLRNKGGDNGC